jgi:hypothetical protein
VWDDTQDGIEWTWTQGNIYWERKMNVGNSFIILFILLEMSLDDVIIMNEYREGFK